MLLEAQSYSAGEFWYTGCKMHKKRRFRSDRVRSEHSDVFRHASGLSETELWIYPPAGTVASILTRSLRHNFCNGNMENAVPFDTAMGNLWPVRQASGVF